MGVEALAECLDFDTASGTDFDDHAWSIRGMASLAVASIASGLDNVPASGARRVIPNEE